MTYPLVAFSTKNKLYAPRPYFPSIIPMAQPKAEGVETMF